MLDRRTLAAAALIVVFAALAALAQRDGYGDRDEAPQPRGATNVSGEFDYYTLVMSWSPTHCASDDGDDDAVQCRRNDGRRYAFVLHGLWPQYEKGYPESCRINRRPFVPQPVIDSMLDIMPNPKLVIHEYRTHGTCSGLDPAGYYELSRRLFESIEIPRRLENPYEAQFLSPEEVMDDFLDANPGLKEDMLAVNCGGPGNRLRDVRICFTTEGAFRACGSNESQDRLCRARSMHLPPVRSTGAGSNARKDRETERTPLPRPRVIEMPRGQ